MPTQKSLVLPAAQANWEVKVSDVPTPGPQDVLVKIAATALNPLDWKIQAFGLYVQNYPYIAGCEAAGTVEEVGGDVKNLAKGDKMYVLSCVCGYMRPVLFRSPSLPPLLPALRVHKENPRCARRVPRAWQVRLGSSCVGVVALSIRGGFEDDSGTVRELAVWRLFRGIRSLRNNRLANRFLPGWNCSPNRSANNRQTINL